MSSYADVTAKGAHQTPEQASVTPNSSPARARGVDSNNQSGFITARHRRMTYCTDETDYSQVFPTPQPDSKPEVPSANPEHVTNNPSHSRAPPMPELEHTDGSETSLIDVDTEHVSTVPSDFSTQSIKTDTQAERIELEAEDKARAEERARAAKEKAHHAREHAKEKARRAGILAKENADNPVILGNIVLTTLLVGGLGYGAYAKHRAGELTWGVAAIGAGIVGAFAAGDYFLSAYLFKKYPPKK